MVLRQGSKLVLIGIALGVVCAWALTRLMTGLLFQVKPADGPTFFIVSVLFCAVALAACFIPAWRATQADPMAALRNE
jgi:ABC-type antimicrobial peptide transport system permease subunit